MRLTVRNFTGLESNIEFTISDAENVYDYEAYIVFSMKYDKYEDYNYLVLHRVDATRTDYWNDITEKVELTEDEFRVLEKTLNEFVDWEEYFQHLNDWQ